MARRGFRVRLRLHRRLILGGQAGCISVEWEGENKGNSARGWGCGRIGAFSCGAARHRFHKGSQRDVGHRVQASVQDLITAPRPASVSVGCAGYTSAANQPCQPAREISAPNQMLVIELALCMRFRAATVSDNL